MDTASVSTYQGSQPWFASWFDSPDYHRLYANRDLAEAERFVDTLLARLQLARSARILDLGCGTGRHARRVAAHGFDVTGLDLSANSIREAGRYAGDRLRFRRHDMRVPFGEHRFDVVLNLFTSFGYFDDERAHVGVLKNVAHALTPCGTLVLDYLNVAYADAHRVPDEVKTVDGVRYRPARWTTATHLFKRITVEHRNANETYTSVEKVARFTRDDFRRMLSRAGLTLEGTLGDYDLSPFDARTSPRLILVARKRLHVVACGPAAERGQAPASTAPGEVPADSTERFRREAQV